MIHDALMTSTSVWWTAILTGDHGQIYESLVAHSIDSAEHLVAMLPSPAGSTRETWS